MKKHLCLLFLPAALASQANAAAARPATPPSGKILVTVANDLDIARPGETIVIPYAQVTGNLTGALFDQVVVKDAKGNPIPSQVTNFNHDHRGPPTYEDLVFQHSFAAGEKTATFTIEPTASPLPPFATLVMARHVPERWDDFAWENDRIAFRIYGPGLETPAAGRGIDQMTSSGIDVWTKRVPYLVMDRWYRKGHDGLHEDTGEGMDFYSVSTNRGVGGTGIWNGSALAVSKNWRTCKVYASGPIRAVFELGYEPWDAGGGVMVAETKRFTIDAGSNLTQAASTFTFTGPADLTAAIGVTRHNNANPQATQNEQGTWAGLWEEYAADGKLGTGIVLAPGANFAGFANSGANLLILAKVTSGTPVNYYFGAGWDRSGQFATPADWNAYLTTFAQRLRSPLKITLAKQ